MAESSSGLEMLQAKMERRSRAVRPPRRPRDPESSPTAERSSTEDAVETVGEPPNVEPSPGAHPSVSTKPASSHERAATTPRSAKTPKSARDNDDRPTTSANEPVANLAVRVRRSLDLRLGDLVYALKREAGVRASKVEIIEMLLWELPSDASPELRSRLAAFRQAAPREEAL